MARLKKPKPRPMQILRAQAAAHLQEVARALRQNGLDGGAHAMRSRPTSYASAVAPSIASADAHGASEMSETRSPTSPATPTSPTSPASWTLPFRITNPRRTDAMRELTSPSPRPGSEELSRPAPAHAPECWPMAFPEELPSVIVGVARVPDWRVDDFVKQLRAWATEHGRGSRSGCPDVSRWVEIRTKPCKVDGESLTDVYIKARRPHKAEEAMMELYGAEIAGRPVRARIIPLDRTKNLEGSPGFAVSTVDGGLGQGR